MINIKCACLSVSESRRGCQQAVNVTRGVAVNHVCIVTLNLQFIHLLLSSTEYQQCSFFLKLITQKPVYQLRLFCSASAGTLTECTYWFSFSLQISCWNINDEKINQSNRQVCSARGLALLNTTQRSTSHNFVKSNKLIKLITCQSYIREKRR